LAALERSFDAHEGMLAWHLAAPTHDFVRDQPRFRAIVEAMGLAPHHAKHLKRTRAAQVVADDSVRTSAP
jgi:hypothetical protein